MSLSGMNGYYDKELKRQLHEEEGDEEEEVHKPKPHLYPQFEKNPTSSYEMSSLNRLKKPSFSFLWHQTQAIVGDG